MYHIVQNVGDGKHRKIWQMDCGFFKILLLMFYKSVKLIPSDPVNLTRGLFVHGYWYYFRPVRSLSSTSTQILPDLDCSLSEKFPAKAIELANAEVE